MIQVATRTDDNSRWAWTLISIAVRIAHALGLQNESASKSISVFEAEMRRRVWYSICMLDSHSSNDRGSDTLIKAPEFNTRLPSNINDSDISPNSTVQPPERVGITEMSSGLYIASCMKLFWELLHVPLGDYERPPTEIQYDWGKRQALVEQHIEFVNEKFIRHCDPSVLLHTFIKGIAAAVEPLLRLIALRPMQRHPAVKAPRVDSAVILGLCIDLFEASHKVYSDPSIRKWGWFFWVQWHPMAVALTELCSYTEGPLLEPAWHVTEYAFQQWADQVADTRRGRLWRPIEKLYKKAKANRAARDAQKVADVKPMNQVLDGRALGPSSSQGYAPDTDMRAPRQPVSMDNTMSGVGDLSVGNEMMNWDMNPNEPIDMAWLEWATFTEDVTDLNILDPISLMDPGWSS